MRNPYLVAAGVFATSLLMVVAAVYVFHRAANSGEFPEALLIGRGATSFQDISTRFQNLARNKGAPYAYEILRRAILPPNTDLHLLGHTVGDELYKQLGVSGIALCTQEFRNACSHTIVIGTLNEFGANDTSLKMIDDACKRAPGGSGAYTMCYHGLGHGVFAYFGYDLSKTVAFCKRMGTAQYHNEQYTQCVGGAIMELVDGGGHDHSAWLAARERYFDSKDPLSPCMNSVIPDAAKNFCLTYLTPHLMVAAGAELAHPDPATFAKAFSFCRAIPVANKRLRDTCFRGFGKEFIPLVSNRDIRHIDRISDAQYNTAIGWCDLAGSSDETDACVREELQSIYWGGESDPDASFRFCALVKEGHGRSACYAELADAIDRYAVGTSKIAQCEQLPQEFRRTCTQKS